MPPQEDAPKDKAPKDKAPKGKARRRPLDALAKVCASVRPADAAEGILGVAPRFVAEPTSVAEAADVMRVAAEHGLAVVPRGGETRLEWGMPPSRCDLLVDTAGLGKVVEHAAGDLVVKAEAGLTMERLAEVLAERGQRLALDTPLPGSTIGGTIATGAAGPLRLLYGSPRDLVIGLTFIRADGQIARSGGKVVKNVAGYDLGRLFSGSYGTLGLIVEAAFRLHPVPTAHAYVTAPVADSSQAHEAVQAVLHSPVAPSALECDASPSGTTIGVLIEGVPDGVAARSTQVADLLGAQAHISQEPPAWWGAYPDGTTLIEVTAPPTALRPLLSETQAQSQAETHGQAPVRWSATGKGFVGLEGPADEVADTLARLRSALARHTGSAVVRYAPEDVRAQADVWGPVPALTLMRRVKDQFDPEHRLSPGRFVGGI